MANQFTNNEKVKLVAGAIADAMDYTKASVSKMSQSEFKGKKFGKSYTVYIPTTGKVVEGTEAEPTDVTEIPTVIDLSNFNVSVELGAWNTIADIGNFRDEIALPLGNQLARTEEKKIVERNVYKSLQSVVAGSAGFGVLSQSAAALRQLAVGGEIVSFMNPDVAAAVSASGLANFIPSEIQKRIYSDNYLGQYAGAAQIETPDLPTLTTPNPMPAATIDLGDAVTDSDSNALGFNVIDHISGAGLKAGLVYKATGLKVVDANGIQTDQDVSIIVLSVSGNTAYISPLRITIDGKGFGNPNAWVPSGTTTLSLTAALDGNATYYVGQVRTKDCFAFDAYRFEDLPGSDNEEVAVVGGHSVKMSEYGEGKTLNKLVRLDAPFAAGIFEPRSSVTVFIKK